MKVKNISAEAQHFATIGTFEPNVEVTVSDDVAEYLLKNPHMESCDDTKKPRTFRGVEKDEK